jgi:5-oxoprolinase (ATP-hydrolysing)
VWPREALRPGQRIAGPAIVAEDTATIVLEPGFVAEIDRGCLVARDLAGASATPVPADARDPVLREVLSRRITAIAQQMGVVLRRTALSTNIRERLDFSCAVFDARGDLVTNAPYIPVHLGAMPESIRGVLAVHPRPPAGAVYVTNDPAAGGSHLPDITVISPVHDEQGALRFFVASRGHHADVGGVAPGSMPPHATTLEEEGVVFRALQVVSDRRFDRAAVLAVLQAGPWPARRPRRTSPTSRRRSQPTKPARASSTSCARSTARRWCPRRCRRSRTTPPRRSPRRSLACPRVSTGFADAMDDGRRDRRRDLAAGPAAARRLHRYGGAGPGQPQRAAGGHRVGVVVRAAPARRAHDAAQLRLPAPGRPDPSARSAVPGARCRGRGGNVETAQRVVDVLLGALGLAAASQGTMNNLTFGDATLVTTRRSAAARVRVGGTRAAAACTRT